MSSRLGEIESRTATARQLESVISAMRGIAAAREREAQGRLAGIRSAAATVGEAIGMVLAAAPFNAPSATPSIYAAEREPDRRLTRIVIVVCTEQGFVGGFNEHLIERVERLQADAAAEIFVVGTRGAMLAQERGLKCAWSVPMAAHADDVMRVAGAITDAVYARFNARDASEVWLVHAIPGPGLEDRIVTRRVVPFDFARFRMSSRMQPPLLNLPRDRLLQGLTERYVYVEVCEGLMQSFAAENAARVAAMLAASQHVKDKLEALTRDYRIVRQDEIMSEIVELASTSAFVQAD
ncbi:FoF1 ATP synthase subunit gamma [Paraburkholderia phymatum]|uniref:F0F1 ATP synthase subunit gamma n=1 Tax=Paraburkholderia phymatum TaxID=148447 RepID=UPI003179ED65